MQVIDYIKDKPTCKWVGDIYIVNKVPFTGIITTDNSKFYFLNGLRHREDGPAICNQNALNNNLCYYLHGKFIKANSLEEFLKIVKLKIYL